MTDYQNIGKRLRDHFNSLGMTQDFVARELDVSRQYVSQHFNGKPFTLKTAYRWSKAFGLSKEWLLNGKGEMFDEKRAISEVDSAPSINPINTEAMNDYLQKLLDQQGSLLEELKAVREERSKLQRLLEQQINLHKQLIDENQLLVKFLQEHFGEDWRGKLPQKKQGTPLRIVSIRDDK